MSPLFCCEKAPLVVGLLFTVILLVSLDFDCPTSFDVCTILHRILNQVFKCSSPALLPSGDKSQLTNTFAESTPKPLPWDSIFAPVKRDVCTDALPGSVSSMCTPSNTSTTTLCCKSSLHTEASLCAYHHIGVRPDSIYPKCSVLLDVGFCCVSRYVVCHRAEKEYKPLTDAMCPVLAIATQTQPRYASATLTQLYANLPTVPMFAVLNTRVAPRATTQNVPSDVKSTPSLFLQGLHLLHPRVKRLRPRPPYQHPPHHPPQHRQSQLHLS